MPWANEAIRVSHLVEEKQKPKLLSKLGALNYDQVNELDSLQMQVADSILALQRQWKINEVDELKRLIRYQLTLELTKMENRKRVRRD